ncbi:hypothetical protein P409_00550 [Inquilinus limosus MP06]|uniref:Uncharacterized protein n=1 Tax=Inquilinus limosus MP06 TaxID=1398085 RepID=A0A0A0DDP9_9PROT|nr:hypothetical protein P409_00550 [Inquilinus limosus MP06]
MFTERGDHALCFFGVGAEHQRDDAWRQRSAEHLPNLVDRQRQSTAEDLGVSTGLVGEFGVLGKQLQRFYAFSPGDL